ncbi:type II toxin-antitoxin system PemI/MazE family antitoxin [Lactobacillus amylovorus]|jgi:antitoxin component of MazEF toxin-antitoxin module|uniref:AbrB family toxin-antitoxin system antitoxin n=1 Tax=Lactobacillus amylovorus TaxID=1604 RepID=A0A9X3W6Y1_LACAM|nr:AbrB family toxin-antitoxin system antitoxin [Lactobacillus amylovorus]MDB6234292.1 AbrB family toxin-antitoxin system antitoxin [Lactobacillus amylovorus]MDB6242457.1 AbrB family toxin-antitoxin system antitoxin [Lactobacillus amylovorus]MDB6248452.1 AbrB family toxin-antitoxin system antitoxin [Lactobacillus amylovorus]MDB6252772.1 AbrB family toxin-antitoxin system antitoxin [Lactobacillus amylovorus]MDB6254567.1 AbrB family toxin-antitoxin system antitoxin [Lactobacillus amylovorus]
MVIKARKQGNSIVLTIPKSLNVPVNTEFTVDLQKNGDLVYKRTNQKGYDLWSDPAYDDYDYEAEIKREYKELGYNPREVTPIGKELDIDKD